MSERIETKMLTIGVILSGEGKKGTHAVRLEAEKLPFGFTVQDIDFDVYRVTDPDKPAFLCRWQIVHNSHSLTGMESAPDTFEGEMEIEDFKGKASAAKNLSSRISAFVKSELQLPEWTPGLD